MLLTFVTDVENRVMHELMVTCHSHLSLGRASSHYPSAIRRGQHSLEIWRPSAALSRVAGIFRIRGGCVGGGNAGPGTAPRSAAAVVLTCFESTGACEVEDESLLSTARSRLQDLKDLTLLLLVACGPNLGAQTCLGALDGKDRDDASDHLMAAVEEPGSTESGASAPFLKACVCHVAPKGPSGLSRP